MQPTLQTTTFEKTKPGRHAYLIELRNHDLIHRLFTLWEIKRMRYDDVLRKLEREFYISQSRIEIIISENRAMFDDLYRQKSA